MVYVTATPEPGLGMSSFPTTVSPSGSAQTISSTQLPLITAVANTDANRTHIVTAGESLFAIAQQYNTTIDTLVELNQLSNPDVITVGQVLQVPAGATLVTPNLILLSDSRFAHGPESDLDVAAFMANQPGYAARVIEPITHRRADGSSEIRFLSGAAIVERVSLETSVDARLLLSMLEYRAGWLSNPSPQELSFPLVSEDASPGIDREGLYRQLSWAANELNRGYYGWKYDSWREMDFADGPRIQFDTSLNSATVAIHYMLHLNRAPGEWLRDISPEGWAATYTRLFGGQLGVSNPIVVQNPPNLALPYSRGETWFFTGGPHGGWGSGSAWAALDFAPPDERPTDTLCFISRFPALSVADGVIARSADGVVVLDLDGDGDERTGWTILYLHLNSATAVGTGQRVSTGDVIGYPACEGGFSTATHLHIGRRFNGEWIPSDCAACTGGSRFSFSMSGWVSEGLPGQEYQGSLRKGSDVRVAEQASDNPINQVTND